MKFKKVYTESFLGYEAMNEVDLRKEYSLTGNLYIPLLRGLWVRCYPYEECWVQLDDEVFHIDSYNAWCIFVNKFTVKFALEKLG